MRIRSVLLVLVIALLALPLCTPPVANGLLVTVAPSPANAAPWSGIQRKAMDLLQKRFQECGALLTERPRQWIVQTDARESGDSVVISLQVGHAVPEEVVRLSHDAEIFYTGLSSERRLPPGGKLVRAVVSEKFMRQFILPLEWTLTVTPADSLEAVLRREAERLTRAHFTGREA